MFSDLQAMIVETIYKSTKKIIINKQKYIFLSVRTRRRRGEKNE